MTQAMTSYLIFKLPSESFTPEDILSGHCNGILRQSGENIVGLAMMRIFSSLEDAKSGIENYYANSDDCYILAFHLDKSDLRTKLADNPNNLHLELTTLYHHDGTEFTLQALEMDEVSDETSPLLIADFLEYMPLGSLNEVQVNALFLQITLLRSIQENTEAEARSTIRFTAAAAA